MQTQGIKRVQFEETGSTADWYFPYQLIVPAMDGWDADRDLIVLGMSPDYSAWDDYGMRSRANLSPRPDFWYAPCYQATSDDESGVVTLVDPNLISIIVPWTAMRRLGPGGCAVGVQYRTKDGTDRRTTLLTGRLPIVDGVV